MYIISSAIYLRMTGERFMRYINLHCLIYELISEYKNVDFSDLY